MSLREQPFMRAILERLQLHPESHWERQNAGVTVVGTGPSRRAFRGAPAGAGDLVGIVGPTGLHVEVEVKVGARQTPNQRERAEQLATLGALYVLVRYNRTLLPAQAVEHAVNEILSAIAEWRATTGAR
jgi:hypothetical protein